MANSYLAVSKFYGPTSREAISSVCYDVRVVLAAALGWLMAKRHRNPILRTDGL